MEPVVNQQDELNQLFNGTTTLEDLNKKDEVINKDNPTPPTPEPVIPPDPENPTPDPIVPPVTPEVPVEEPYYKKQGFETQESLDTFLAGAKKPKEPEYKSTLAKEYDNFVKATGLDDFNKFQFYKNTEIKADSTPQDYVDILVQKAILDNPEYAEFKDTLTAKYRSNYKLDIEMEFADADEKMEAALKKTELRNEAQKVISEISEIKEKMTNNGVTQKEIDELTTKTEGNKKQWADFTTKMADEFKLEIKDFDLDADGKEKVLETVLKSYTFDKDVKEFFKATADSIVAFDQFQDPSPDGGAKVKELATMATVYKYLPRLLKEAMAQTEARIFKEYNIERDNPSSKKEVAKNEDGSKVISERQAAREAFGLK